MDSEPFVLFELAGSVYGIASACVRHIDMCEHVTPVPNANPAVEGIVFSRGQVIPALNLRTRFGFPRQDSSLRTRIIFAEVHDRVVGLIVDAANEFRNLPRASIHPVEQTLTGIHRRYLQAVTEVAGRLVLILDLPAVLNLADVPSPTATHSAPIPTAALE